MSADENADNFDFSTAKNYEKIVNDTHSSVKIQFENVNHLNIVMLGSERESVQKIFSSIVNRQTVSVNENDFVYKSIQTTGIQIYQSLEESFKAIKSMNHIPKLETAEGYDTIRRLSDKIKEIYTMYFTIYERYEQYIQNTGVFGLIEFTNKTFIFDEREYWNHVVTNLSSHTVNDTGRSWNLLNTFYVSNGPDINKCKKVNAQLKSLVDTYKQYVDNVYVDHEKCKREYISIKTIDEMKNYKEEQCVNSLLRKLSEHENQLVNDFQKVYGFAGFGSFLQYNEQIEKNSDFKNEFSDFNTNMISYQELYLQTSKYNLKIRRAHEERLLHIYHIPPEDDIKQILQLRRQAKDTKNITIVLQTQATVNLKILKDNEENFFSYCKSNDSNITLNQDKDKCIVYLGAAYNYYKDYKWIYAKTHKCFEHLRYIGKSHEPGQLNISSNYFKKEISRALKEAQVEYDKYVTIYRELLAIFTQKRSEFNKYERIVDEWHSRNQYQARFGSTKPTPVSDIQTEIDQANAFCAKVGAAYDMIDETSRKFELWTKESMTQYVRVQAILNIRVKNIYIKRGSNARDVSDLNYDFTDNKKYDDFLLYMYNEIMQITIVPEFTCEKAKDFISNIFFPLQQLYKMFITFTEKYEKYIQQVGLCGFDKNLYHDFMTTFVTDVTNPQRPTDIANAIVNVKQNIIDPCTQTLQEKVTNIKRVMGDYQTSKDQNQYTIIQKDIHHQVYSDIHQLGSDMYLLIDNYLNNESYKKFRSYLDQLYIRPDDKLYQMNDLNVEYEPTFQTLSELMLRLKIEAIHGIYKYNIENASLYIQYFIDSKSITQEEIDEIENCKFQIDSQENKIKLICTSIDTKIKQLKQIYDQAIQKFNIEMNKLLQAKNIEQTSNSINFPEHLFTDYSNVENELDGLFVKCSQSMDLILKTISNTKNKLTIPSIHHHFIQQETRKEQIHKYYVDKCETLKKDFHINFKQKVVSLEQKRFEWEYVLSEKTQQPQFSMFVAVDKDNSDPNQNGDEADQIIAYHKEVQDASTFILNSLKKAHEIDDNSKMIYDTCQQNFKEEMAKINGLTYKELAGIKSNYPYCFGEVINTCATLWTITRRCEAKLKSVCEKFLNFKNPETLLKVLDSTAKLTESFKRYDEIVNIYISTITSMDIYIIFAGQCILFSENDFWKLFIEDKLNLNHRGPSVLTDASMAKVREYLQLCGETTDQASLEFEKIMTQHHVLADQYSYVRVESNGTVYPNYEYNSTLNPRLINISNEVGKLLRFMRDNLKPSEFLKYMYRIYDGDQSKDTDYRNLFVDYKTKMSRAFIMYLKPLFFYVRLYFSHINYLVEALNISQKEIYDLILFKQYNLDNEKWLQSTHDELTVLSQDIKHQYETDLKLYNQYKHTLENATSMEEIDKCQSEKDKLFVKYKLAVPEIAISFKSFYERCQPNTTLRNQQSSKACLQREISTEIGREDEILAKYIQMTKLLENDSYVSFQNIVLHPDQIMQEWDHLKYKRQVYITKITQINSAITIMNKNMSYIKSIQKYIKAKEQTFKKTFQDESTMENYFTSILKNNENEFDKNYNKTPYDVNVMNLTVFEKQYRECVQPMTELTQLFAELNANDNMKTLRDELNEKISQRVQEIHDLLLVYDNFQQEFGDYQNTFDHNVQMKNIMASYEKVKKTIQTSYNEKKQQVETYKVENNLLIEKCEQIISQLKIELETHQTLINNNETPKSDNVDRLIAELRTSIQTFANPKTFPVDDFPKLKADIEQYITVYVTSKYKFYNDMLAEISYITKFQRLAFKTINTTNDLNRITEKINNFKTIYSADIVDKLKTLHKSQQLESEMKSYNGLIYEIKMLISTSRVSIQNIEQEYLQMDVQPKPVADTITRSVTDYLQRFADLKTTYEKIESDFTNITKDSQTYFAQFEIWKTEYESILAFQLDINQKISTIQSIQSSLTMALNTFKTQCDHIEDEKKIYMATIESFTNFDQVENFKDYENIKECTELKNMQTQISANLNKFNTLIAELSQATPSPESNFEDIKQIVDEINKTKALQCAEFQTAESDFNVRLNYGLQTTCFISNAESLQKEVRDIKQIQISKIEHNLFENHKLLQNQQIGTYDEYIKVLGDDMKKYHLTCQKTSQDDANIITQISDFTELDQLDAYQTTILQNKPCDQIKREDDEIRDKITQLQRIIELLRAYIPYKILHANNDQTLLKSIDAYTQEIKEKISQYDLVYQAIIKDYESAKQNIQYCFSSNDSEANTIPDEEQRILEHINNQRIKIKNDKLIKQCEIDFASLRDKIQKTQKLLITDHTNLVVQAGSYDENCFNNMKTQKPKQYNSRLETINTFLNTCSQKPLAYAKDISIFESTANVLFDQYREFANSQRDMYLQIINEINQANGEFVLAIQQVQKNISDYVVQFKSWEDQTNNAIAYSHLINQKATLIQEHITLCETSLNAFANLSQDMEKHKLNEIETIQNLTSINEIDTYQSQIQSKCQEVIQQGTKLHDELTKLDTLINDFIATVPTQPLTYNDVQNRYSVTKVSKEKKIAKFQTISNDLLIKYKNHIQGLCYQNGENSLDHSLMLVKNQRIVDLTCMNFNDKLEAAITNFQKQINTIKTLLKKLTIYTDQHTFIAAFSNIVKIDQDILLKNYQSIIATIDSVIQDIVQQQSSDSTDREQVQQCANNPAIHADTRQRYTATLKRYTDQESEHASLRANYQSITQNVEKNISFYYALFTTRQENYEKVSNFQERIADKIQKFTAKYASISSMLGKLREDIKNDLEVRFTKLRQLIQNFETIDEVDQYKISLQYIDLTRALNDYYSGQFKTITTELKELGDLLSEFENIQVTALSDYQDKISDEYINGYLDTVMNAKATNIQKMKSALSELDIELSSSVIKREYVDLDVCETHWSSVTQNKKDQLKKEQELSEIQYLRYLQSEAEVKVQELDIQKNNIKLDEIRIYTMNDISQYFQDLYTTSKDKSDFESTYQKKLLDLQQNQTELTTKYNTHEAEITEICNNLDQIKRTMQTKIDKIPNDEITNEFKSFLINIDKLFQDTTSFLKSYVTGLNTLRDSIAQFNIYYDHTLRFITMREHTENNVRQWIADKSQMWQNIQDANQIELRDLHTHFLSDCDRIRNLFKNRLVEIENASEISQVQQNNWLSSKLCDQITNLSSELEQVFNKNISQVSDFKNSLEPSSYQDLFSQAQNYDPNDTENRSEDLQSHVTSLKTLLDKSCNELSKEINRYTLTTQTEIVQLSQRITEMQSLSNQQKQSVQVCFSDETAHWDNEIKKRQSQLKIDGYKNQVSDIHSQITDYKEELKVRLSKLDQVFLDRRDFYNIFNTYTSSQLIQNDYTSTIFNVMQSSLQQINWDSIFENIAKFKQAVNDLKSRIESETATPHDPNNDDFQSQLSSLKESVNLFLSDLDEIEQHIASKKQEFENSIQQTNTDFNIFLQEFTKLEHDYSEVKNRLNVIVTEQNKLNTKITQVNDNDIPLLKQQCNQAKTIIRERCHSLSHLAVYTQASTNFTNSLQSTTVLNTRSSISAQINQLSQEILNYKSTFYINPIIHTTPPRLKLQSDYNDIIDENNKQLQAAEQLLLSNLQDVNNTLETYVKSEEQILFNGQLEQNEYDKALHQSLEMHKSIKIDLQRHIDKLYMEMQKLNTEHDTLYASFQTKRDHVLPLIDQARSLDASELASVNEFADKSPMLLNQMNSVQQELNGVIAQLKDKILHLMEHENFILGYTTNTNNQTQLSDLDFGDPIRDISTEIENMEMSIHQKITNTEIMPNLQLILSRDQQQKLENNLCAVLDNIHVGITAKSDEINKYLLQLQQDIVHIIGLNQEKLYEIENIPSSEELEQKRHVFIRESKEYLAAVQLENQLKINMNDFNEQFANLRATDNSQPAAVISKHEQIRKSIEESLTDHMFNTAIINPSDIFQINHLTTTNETSYWTQVYENALNTSRIKEQIANDNHVYNNLGPIIRDLYLNENELLKLHYNHEDIKHKFHTIKDYFAETLRFVRHSIQAFSFTMNDMQVLSFDNFHKQMEIENFKEMIIEKQNFLSIKSNTKKSDNSAQILETLVSYVNIRLQNIKIIVTPDLQSDLFINDLHEKLMNTQKSFYTDDLKIDFNVIATQYTDIVNMIKTHTELQNELKQAKNEMIKKQNSINVLVQTKNIPLDSVLYDYDDHVIRFLFVNHTMKKIDSDIEGLKKQILIYIAMWQALVANLDLHIYNDKIGDIRSWYMTLRQHETEYLKQMPEYTADTDLCKNIEIWNRAVADIIEIYMFHNFNQEHSQNTDTSDLSLIHLNTILSKFNSFTPIQLTSTTIHQFYNEIISCVDRALVYVTDRFNLRMTNLFDFKLSLLSKCYQMASIQYEVDKIVANVDEQISRTFDTFNQRLISFYELCLQMHRFLNDRPQIDKDELQDTITRIESLIQKNLSMMIQEHYTDVISYLDAKLEENNILVLEDVLQIIVTKDNRIIELFYDLIENRFTNTLSNTSISESFKNSIIDLHALFNSQNHVLQERIQQINTKYKTLQQFFEDKSKELQTLYYELKTGIDLFILRYKTFDSMKMLESELLDFKSKVGIGSYDSTTLLSSSTIQDYYNKFITYRFAMYKNAYENYINTDVYKLEAKHVGSCYYNRYVHQIMDQYTFLSDQFEEARKINLDLEQRQDVLNHQEKNVNKEYIDLFAHLYPKSMQTILPFMFILVNHLYDTNPEEYTKCAFTNLEEIYKLYVSNTTTKSSYYPHVAISKIIIGHDINILPTKNRQDRIYSVLKDIFVFFRDKKKLLKNDQDTYQRICTRFAMFYKLGNYSYITLKNHTEIPVGEVCIFNNDVSIIGINNIAFFLNFNADLSRKKHYLLTGLLDMTDVSKQNKEVTKSQILSHLKNYDHPKRFAHMLIPVFWNKMFFLCSIKVNSDNDATQYRILIPKHLYNLDKSYNANFWDIILACVEQIFSINISNVRDHMKLESLHYNGLNEYNVNGGLDVMTYMLSLPANKMVYQDPFIASLTNALTQNESFKNDPKFQYKIYNFLVRVITPNENDEYPDSLDCDSKFMSQCTDILLQSETKIKMFLLSQTLEKNTSGNSSSSIHVN